MKQQRNPLSAPQAALVHALTQCLNSAFASNEITAFDIRNAIDLAWQRAWDAARREPEAEPESPELPIIEERIRFVRKPCDLLEVFEWAKSGDLETKVEIHAKVELSEAEYDAFAARPLNDWSMLTGMGDHSENGVRRVVEITAPDRLTLFVDPCGSSYARYVGIREIDLEQVSA